MRTGAGRRGDQNEERKVSVADEAAGGGGSTMLGKQGPEERTTPGRGGQRGCRCEIKDQTRAPTGEMERNAFQKDLEGGVNKTW